MVDTVGITADRSTEVGLIVLRQISLYAVKSKHYIAHLAFAIRNLEGHYTASVVGDSHFHTATALH